MIPCVRISHTRYSAYHLRLFFSKALYLRFIACWTRGDSHSKFIQAILNSEYTFVDWFLVLAKLATNHFDSVSLFAPSRNGRAGAMSCPCPSPSHSSGAIAPLDTLSRDFDASVSCSTSGALYHSNLLVPANFPTFDVIWPYHPPIISLKARANK